MKKLTYALVLMGVPLVFAVVTASVSYAWNTFTVDPRPVHADGAGVDTKDGYTVVTLKNGDTEYLVVTSYGPYEGERKEELKGKPRQFVTVYEIARKGEGKAEFILVGSRCIEWDRGFELVNFKKDDSAPSKLRGPRD